MAFEFGRSTVSSSSLEEIFDARLEDEEETLDQQPQQHQLHDQSSLEHGKEQSDSISVRYDAQTMMMSSSSNSSSAISRHEQGNQQRQEEQSQMDWRALKVNPLLVGLGPRRERTKPIGVGLPSLEMIQGLEHNPEFKEKAQRVLDCLFKDAEPPFTTIDVLYEAAGVGVVVNLQQASQLIRASEKFAEAGILRASDLYPLLDEELMHFGIPRNLLPRLRKVLCDYRRIRKGKSDFVKKVRAQWRDWTPGEESNGKHLDQWLNERLAELRSSNRKRRRLDNSDNS